MVVETPVSLPTTNAAPRAGRDVSRPHPIRVILLATDLSAASDEATRQAIELCRMLQASLLVVNVIDRADRGDRTTIGQHATRIDQHRAQREPRLLDIVERSRASGVDSTFLLWTGEAGPGIVAAAEAEQADMVVVGTHGRGRAGRLLLGSVSEYVVYNSAIPVLVAR